MAIVNHAKMEVNAKIIYFGPPGSGKNNSLTYIHSRIKPSLRGELKCTTTGGDKLLFFDFSPFEAPLKHGYTVRLHLYTLTGPVSNPATWKMVLKGADGVIIQVDGAAQHVSSARESVSRLRDFLSVYGVGLRDTAVVLQCNAVEPQAPLLTAAVLAAELGLPDITAVHSMAARGEGVLEAFSSLSKMVLSHIEDLVFNDAISGSNSGSTDDRSVTTDVQTTQAPSESGAEIVPPSEKKELVITCAAPAVNGTTMRLPIDISCGGVNRQMVVTISIEL